jgi:hypothetical protein
VGVKPSFVHDGGTAEGNLGPYSSPIDTGKPSSSNNLPMFKFELGWLLRDGFMKMIKNVWDCVNDIWGGGDSMRCWQSKI